MPLNGQLLERGARLLAAPRRRPTTGCSHCPAPTPPKPGLLRVAAGTGAQIAVEVWEMPMAHYGSFVALIPAPLGIGSLSLADGSTVQGFICEPQALQGALDISHLGGWRAYIAARAAAV
jgi:allophanate hydrolase